MKSDSAREIESLLFRAAVLELQAAMLRFSAAAVYATEGFERFAQALSDAEYLGEE